MNRLSDASIWEMINMYASYFRSAVMHTLTVSPGSIINRKDPSRASDLLSGVFPRELHGHILLPHHGAADPQIPPDCHRAGRGLDGRGRRSHGIWWPSWMRSDKQHGKTIIYQYWSSVLFFPPLITVLLDNSYTTNQKVWTHLLIHFYTADLNISNI